MSTVGSSIGGKTRPLKGWPSESHSRNISHRRPLLPKLTAASDAQHLLWNRISIWIHGHTHAYRQSGRLPSCLWHAVFGTSNDSPNHRGPPSEYGAEYGVKVLLYTSPPAERWPGNLLVALI
jgi:hypothetical protein